MDRTYLELSESGGGSHKFYEVLVKGKQVTTRYGRIGTNGQTKVKDYASPAAAQKEAEKQLAGKRKKGYAAASEGKRKKRPVLSGKAPVLWKFKTGDSALGIYVDDDRVWVGDQGGRVFALSHDGKVLVQYKLSDGVKALVGDDRWIYAGCDDGQVYDLSCKVPTVAYEIAPNTEVLWLEIFGGRLCVSDGRSRCTVYDHEGEQLWSSKPKGRQGWMVRADEAGVYHGQGGWHGAGSVTHFDWKGKEKWSKKTPKGGVGFGWQETEHVFASTTKYGGKGHVYAFAKKGGKPGPVCNADSPLLSCSASEGGTYIFGGSDRQEVYCFRADGSRFWKLQTTCGSPQSMQYHNERLYMVTHQGVLACMDASEAAIERASKGKLPKARQIKAPAAATARKITDKLKTAAAGAKGVLVRCEKKGSKLRVVVVSPGYNAKWNVQFPRNLREDGALFLVDELVEAKQGGFYRAAGEIQRTSEAGLTKKKTTKKKTAKKKTAEKKTAKKKTAKKKTAKKKATKKKATKKAKKKAKKK